MFINQATVYGNLTRDPELKALPSGQQVCTFSIATNRRYKDRDGNQQEEVQYHNIVVWGKTAENVARYMKKGSPIYIQGELKTQSWEKDGHKNYRTEIHASPYGVQFGPKREGQGGGAAPAQQHNAATTSSQDAGMQDYPEEEINPDDIPF